MKVIQVNPLEDISQTLFQIYTKNIHYLEKSHRQLFDKIKRFESLQIENYYIDFVENHFELCQSDGTPLYNCDPFYDGQYRAKNLSNEKVFTLIQETSTSKKVHYEDSLNGYADINEFINIYPYSQLHTNINKFIFIGTLLGVHINDIDKVIQAKSYLILENNIEIFRLSLFMSDYEVLGKHSKLFFCIDYDESELKKSVKSFLDFEYQYNTKIPFEVASTQEIDLLEQLSIEIAQNSQMTYPYSEYIVSMQRGYEYFKKAKNGILNINQLSHLLENKTVLFLGAGVSVSSYLEWIYLHQDRFIIVCASAILKRLELLGVVPDIILVIDGQKDVVLEQFEVSKEMYQKSIILASMKIDGDLFEKIESDTTFYLQDSFELFEDCGILTGVTVGDIGISLLLQFGVKNLYLLGFDACISSINHKTHDSLHKSSRKININYQGNSYDNHIVKVKGNFRDEVYTFIFYTGMIDNISNICSLNSTRDIYNLSDGAYFSSAVPKKVEDIELETLEIVNKKILQNDFLEVLYRNCKKELNQKDINYLKKEKKVLQKLQQMKKENIGFEMEKLKSNYQNSSIVQILEKYLKLTSPYSYYCNNVTIQRGQLEKIIAKLEAIIKSVI